MREHPDTLTLRAIGRDLLARTQRGEFGAAGSRLRNVINEHVASLFEAADGLDEMLEQLRPRTARERAGRLAPPAASPVHEECQAQHSAAATAMAAEAV